MDIVRKARATLWTRESLLATLRDDDVPSYRRYLITITALWRAYEDILHDMVLLDFSDLIRMVVEKLRADESLGKHFAGRFDHILVDEFQDTSEAQNELLRLIAGETFPRVTVVGDEKQSVYRWRDARVENLREFEGEPAFLKINYRSTQPILDLAYYVITDDEHFRKHAAEIHLEAHRGTSDVPICIFHPEDGAKPSANGEAWALGAWILALTGSGSGGRTAFEHCNEPPGLDFGDIAILMRSLKPASGLPEYEAVLKELRIPYAILGGVSDHEHQVLDRFKNLLRLLVYPDDARAFLSVVESKPMSIPDAALEELFRTADRPFNVHRYLSEVTLSELTDARARDRLQELRRILDELTERRSELDLGTFILDAMELTQFYFQLFADGGDIRIIDSISKRLFELLEQLAQKNEPHLAAFLEVVQTLLEKKEFAEDDAPYVPAGRVIIMTQHQAKGLQFPAVAIPGIKNQRGGRDGWYLIKGEGLYLSGKDDWNRGSADNEAVERAKEETRQEERCLLYVAMTRAKDHLFISTPHANGMERSQRSQRHKPNLFSSILAILREKGLRYEECRKTPRLDPVSPAAAVEAAGDASRPRELLQEWSANRERLDEARVSVKPAPQGLDFVSWRGLHAFRQCPMRYHYRYVASLEHELGTGSEIRPDEDREHADDGDGRFPGGMAPQEYGSFVHRFLYEWHGQRPADDTLDDFLVAFIERYGVREAVRSEVLEFTKARVEGVARDATRESIHQLEWPVRLRRGGVVFHGVVDRVDRDKEGLRIVDYKVGVEKEEYSYQIQFYAWMLERVRKDHVSSGVISYLHGKPATVHVSVCRDDLEHIDSAARELAEATADRDYPAHPGTTCRTCDFKMLCPHATVESGR